VRIYQICPTQALLLQTSRLVAQLRKAILAPASWCDPGAITHVQCRGAVLLSGARYVPSWYVGAPYGCSTRQPMPANRFAKLLAWRHHALAKRWVAAT
jgi:hypothetical protein